MNVWTGLGLGWLLMKALDGGKKTAEKEKPQAPNQTPAQQADALVDKTVKEVLDKGVKLGLGALGGAGGLGAIGGIGGGGGSAGGSAASAASIKEAITALIPATVAGVSTGFLIVAGAWGLALAAGFVFSALLAPEFARRGTMGRSYGAERGSFQWRAGRLYWATLVSKRLNWAVLQLRWPDLDTSWGQLNVLGFLPVVLRPGEAFPNRADANYPDDQYEVYGWPFRREASQPLAKFYVSQARILAELWTLGTVSAIKACGIAAGDVQNTDKPFVDDLYTADGAGILDIRGNDGSDIPPMEEQRAAWVEGVQNGLAFVRGHSTGFAGGNIMKASDASNVAMRLAEWQPMPMQTKEQIGTPTMFVANGRWLTITNDAGDAVSVEIRVV